MDFKAPHSAIGEDFPSRRIAYVGTWMPERQDCWPGPVDTEWLLHQGQHHEFEIILDQFCPGSEKLRRQGFKVNISARREVNLSEDLALKADEAQANLLLKKHLHKPFDAIIYSSDRTTDLAWFEVGLGEIPRGVALGAGLPQDLRKIWGDTSLFSSLAPQARHTTGFIRSADFLLSDVSPTAFGLGREALWPKRMVTRTLEANPRGEASPQWVVITAMSLDRRSLVNLVPRVAAELPADPRTTFIVLVNDPPLVTEPLAGLVRRNLDPALGERTIVVPVGVDSSAFEFLQEADLLVLSSLADLSVRAVGDACANTPFQWLEGTLESPAAEFPDFSPQPVEPQTALMMKVPRDFRTFTTTLPSLLKPESAESFLLLYEPQHEKDAMQFLDCRNLRAVDLVFWGDRTQPYGESNPRRLSPHIIAINRSLWPSLPFALRQADHLQEFIDLSADLANTSTITPLVLPSRIEESSFFQPTVHHLKPLIWPTAASVLPPPPPLAIEVPTGPTVQEVADRVWERSLVRWIRNHRWTDRVRLALPWKLGILETSMKGKWL